MVNNHPYKEVPVEAAQAIAERCEKAVVVVIAWDRGHDKVHATTFGVTADDKLASVRLRDLCLRAIGVDPSWHEKTFEDFRDRQAAEWKEERDQLLAEIARLKGAQA